MKVSSVNARVGTFTGVRSDSLVTSVPKKAKPNNPMSLADILPLTAILGTGLMALYFSKAGSFDAVKTSALKLNKLV